MAIDRGIPWLPPADVYDPVVEYYMQFVDMEELRANLALTPDERVKKFEKKMRLLREKQEAEAEAGVGHA